MHKVNTTCVFPTKIEIRSFTTRILRRICQRPCAAISNLSWLRLGAIGEQETLKNGCCNHLGSFQKRNGRLNFQELNIDSVLTSNKKIHRPRHVAHMTMYLELTYCYSSFRSFSSPAAIRFSCQLLKSLHSQLF